MSQALQTSVKTSAATAPAPATSTEQVAAVPAKPTRPDKTLCFGPDGSYLGRLGQK